MTADWFRLRRDWTCPRGCPEQLWAHQLYDDECPPPSKPRDCCGRLENTPDDEVRACSNGGCRAWWCLCGTFTGMSDGPVLCGCEYDRGEVSTDPPKKS